MSQFDTDFAAGPRADQLTYFGQSVTHKPSAGGSTAGTAKFKDQRDQVTQGQNGRVRLREGELSISTADFTAALGDEFTIAGEDWRLDEKISESGGFAVWRVLRVEQIENTRDDLRIDR